jgi:glycosyltransferase involved in cell wall biosynthesis
MPDVPWLNSVPVGILPPKRALRVYVLTPGFPPTVGGQEKHLLELCDSLTAAGAAIRVLTRRVDPSFPAEETLGGVPVLRLTPFGEIKGVGFRAVPRLGFLLCKMTWRLLRDARRYDVVLVSGFNFMPLTAILTGLVTRKPCVVRPESPLEVTEPIGIDSRRKMGLSETSLPIRLIGALRRRAARGVDRYVAISSEIRAGLERVGVDAGRIVAIPNGIAVGRFEPVSAARKTQLRAALGLPAEALLLIYTGRLAITKGVMMLIDVWAELAPAHGAAHLLVVGAGRGSFDDCEPALRDFIRARDLAPCVTLTGSVTNVSEYLQASDVFVFPSDYEGFSLSILEAMSVGLPLVSTRVGIAAELAQKAPFGILVPPQDRTAFRDALRRLLSDPPLRAAMGLSAREAVHEQYSLGAEARRYIELFSELTEAAAN